MARFASSERFCRLLPAVFVVWIASAGSVSRAAEDKIDFARDIQPIFQNSCVECHGAQKQKGGLRLDSRAAGMKGGTTGTAIIAGKAAESLLVQRIKGIGDDPRMPEKKPALADAQIAL